MQSLGYQHSNKSARRDRKEKSIKDVLFKIMIPYRLLLHWQRGEKLKRVGILGNDSVSPMSAGFDSINLEIATFF